MELENLVNGITVEIASSTTSYLGVFSPIFLLIGGIILAFGIMAYLVGFLTGNREPIETIDFDNDLADDLEEFYSRRGRTRGQYNYDDIV